MNADDQGATIELSLIGLSEHARNLHRDGYCREAVRHESQRLLNRLRILADQPELDGQPLIERAFSEKAPILVLNDLSTRLERNEQAGLRYLLLGVARGVRNVLTHDIEREVSAQECAVWLGLIGWLHQQLDLVEYVAPAAEDAQPEPGAAP